MVELPESAVKLIDGRNFAHLATLRPDGSPNVTPVWIDREEDILLVNTGDRRAKVRHVKRDPRVALSIYDQENPYHAAFVRGRVVEVTYEGAEEHIDRMAQKYLGRERYPWKAPEERRILLKIKPVHVKIM